MKEKFNVFLLACVFISTPALAMPTPVYTDPRTPPPLPSLLITCGPVEAEGLALKEGQKYVCCRRVRWKTGWNTEKKQWEAPFKTEGPIESCSVLSP